ncbi:ATP-binding cassette domain-containing protein [Ruegeria sp. Ofav3-42]|uniref:thiamine ABC transporter ATP-binding protein n=1 Tax=Ruegeria sp. Ofav3-42 TaxID=2917759 RepID=UPI001EF40C09|nr:ATP-binding cassette domain-containing protein [Ruegeria sp. Ofav3-42]MCG7519875.1 ATP-binding cassette domain-containing protein [Ruegeria sp. Ofav3-42]
MLKLDDCLIKNGNFTLRANIQIEAGTSVAIIGPSGAGKSTLLETIAGFRDLKRGQIFWKHKCVSNLHPGKRPLAMLFQDGNLFPHLTAEQNIALGLRPNGRLSKDEETQVQSALDRVALPGLGGRRPSELSGGQQSRVALARVLVQRREILLLDEPFAALGPALKAEMLDLVADLVAESDTTLLMVSHDPQDARRIAQQTVLVADEIAHPPAVTEQLFENPPPSLREYLG